MKILNFWDRNTVARVSNIYIEHLRSRNIKKKTIANKISGHNKLIKSFGSMRVRAIKPYHIAQLIKEEQKKGHLVTAKSIFYTACEFFDIMLINGFVDNNAARALPTPRAPVKRKRLSVESMEKILDYSKRKITTPWLYPAFCLAFVSAQRRADIAKMKKTDIKDGFLFVSQQKTGSKIALPTTLQLSAFNLDLEGVIEMCARTTNNDFLLSQKSGKALSPISLTHAFDRCYKATHGEWSGDGFKPSFHEIRSLSERLYRAQGVDTQTLLGHKTKSMTDLYNDDRGLDSQTFKFLIL